MSRHRGTGLEFGKACGLAPPRWTLSSSPGVRQCLAVTCPLHHLQDAGGPLQGREGARALP